MRISTLVLASASLVAIAGPAAADTVVALIGGNQLTTIESGSWTVTGTVTVTGDRLLGIDVRPSNGMLYGLTDGNAIVTIDPATGEATKVSDLSQGVAVEVDPATYQPRGIFAVVDFNPVADRLRVITSDGSNYRINVADGAVTVDGDLAIAGGNETAGMGITAIAGAYTSSSVGPAPTATQLFDIAGNGTLFLQAPPNDGTLNRIGGIAMTLSGPVAFDIQTDFGWLMVGDTIYSVNLDTAETAIAATIDGLSGPVTDIAIIAD
jgi:hypothetical protein